MPNPELLQLLEQIKTIHEKKSQDYSAGGNYENFIRSALVASWFKNDSDKAFVVLIATKLARLATLLNSGKDPNNESIDDSFLDLTTYCALWASFQKERNKPIECLLSAHYTIDIGLQNRHLLGGD